MCWVLVLAHEIQFPDQVECRTPSNWIAWDSLATRLDYQEIMAPVLCRSWWALVGRAGLWDQAGQWGLSEDLRTNVLAHWHGKGAELDSIVGGCEARVPDLVLACWWMGAVPDMVLKAAIGLLVSGLLYQDHVEKDQMRWERYSVHL